MQTGQIWAVVIAAVGLVLTILNIADRVMNFYRISHEPEKRQDEKIAMLEVEMRELKEAIKDKEKEYDISLLSNSEHIQTVEAQMTYTTTVILRSLQALTSHALDNNHIEQLKKSKEELDEYLLTRPTFGVSHEKK